MPAERPRGGGRIRPAFLLGFRGSESWLSQPEPRNKRGLFPTECLTDSHTSRGGLEKGHNAALFAAEQTASWADLPPGHPRSSLTGHGGPRAPPSSSQRAPVLSPQHPVGGEPSRPAEACARDVCEPHAASDTPSEGAQGHGRAVLTHVPEPRPGLFTGFLSPEKFSHGPTGTANTQQGGH